MRIGYASLTTGVRKTNFKSCTQKNANDENLLKLIEHNLDSLDNIIDYNIENNIRMFRISSDIIPFGSSPVNTLLWWEIFKDKLKSIGNKIKAGKIRVSMHPGQYTVLNSPSADVVYRSILDLEYHNRFLDSLKVDKQSKIILHVGGVYGDKESAIQRFIENYKFLSDNVKDRLIIENDDVSYNIEEVLYIANILKIPVVYDNLHNEIINSDLSKSDNYWINETKKTWKKEDGPQKTHYSQQNPIKRPGAHSETIYLNKFLKYIDNIENKNIDIMLEVKDKNLSAVKCINATHHNNIIFLELDWSKYKYTILEKSPKNYNKIRQLLKDKNSYSVVEFYRLIEESLFLPEDVGYTVNALEHVWGYFKKFSSDKERLQYQKLLLAYKQGTKRKQLVKNLLERLAIKYESTYLLNSYYFSI